jgi:TetR/AcrR family transcriptional regulator, ethionamide resistance regulator
VTLSQETLSARRHDARRREIVDRLLPVVEARVRELGSYANLRVDDLLPDALLSRSTFYRYFQDKNELLMALAEPVFRDVRAAAIRPWERRTAPTRTELQAELRYTFDLYLPHLPVINAIVEASYASPAIRALYQGGFAEVQQAVADHITAGQQAGFIRTDVLAHETAGWIVWMAERGMAQLAATADDDTLERLAESIATLIWRTFYGL